MYVASWELLSYITFHHEGLYLFFFSTHHGLCYRPMSFALRINIYDPSLKGWMKGVSYVNQLFLGKSFSLYVNHITQSGVLSIMMFRFSAFLNQY